MADYPHDKDLSLENLEREGIMPRPTPFRRTTTPLALSNDVVLDPNDPFESAIADVVLKARAKRRDLTLIDNPFINFRMISSTMAVKDFGDREAALFNVIQEIARIAMLRANERMDDTVNETDDSTFLNLAVYACLCYAIHKSDLDNGED